MPVGRRIETADAHAEAADVAQLDAGVANVAQMERNARAW
jgi:hypothetical protein